MLHREHGVHVLHTRDAWTVLSLHDEQNRFELLQTLKMTQPRWF
jgi:hypothetical protein